MLAGALFHSRTRDTTVDDCRETPRATHEKLVDEQHHHPRRPAGHHRGEDGPTNGVAVPRAADRALAAAVKRHEPRDEDEAAEGDERHRVAGDGVDPRRGGRLG